MAPEPHLELATKHRLGSLTINARFAAAAPWTVLFGPSGSGKSTLLRTIAGLEQPETLRLTIAGKIIADTSQNLDTPAHLRPVRWAAQRSTLFAGRSVRQQLSLGVRRTGNVIAKDHTDRVIEHFALQALATKRPEQLSGGERQRIAVIRAAASVVSSPTIRLLLLDEPFSGLDAPVRNQLMEDLIAWLGKTPVISVTHDVGEAFLLGAEVIRISAGRVVAQGSAAAVLEQERRSLLKLLG